MKDRVTAALAEYIATLDASRLPKEVVSRARLCMLDSVGCMLGGTGMAEVRDSVDLVLGWGQRPDAAVPGLPGRYPVPLAAYASAQLANALDYDDTVLGVGHPGAAVIASALAVGQSHRASGSELVGAVVAGYDVAIRIGRGLEPTPSRARQVRGHSWAVFGAVAAAAALLDLGAERTATAFGLAAQHSQVPFVGKWYERPITSLKNNYGWAAAGGVLAAELAARGGRCTRDVLDGESGFWAMAASDRWERRNVVDGLGTHFAVLDVGHKPFATCRYTHVALGVLDTLIREHAPNPAAIRAVVVRTDERARVFADYQPRTLVDAQFSLPSAVAGMLLGRPLTSFDPDDRDRADLGNRVRIEIERDADHRDHTPDRRVAVEIELEGGRLLAHRSSVLPGTPDSPLSADELRAKFLTLATPVLGSARADALHRGIYVEPQLPSATALAEMFS